MTQPPGSAPGSPAGPGRPQEFGWLLSQFASSTPGVKFALIVSSDGLALVESGTLPADFVDPMAALTSGMISLSNNIARHVGESGCDQIMLKFAAGHLLFMSIGTLAGLVVLVGEGANLGAVAHQMTQFVGGAGHVLTPQMRDDLRQMTVRATS
ncbi:roadblock/LC7 domain-containing protein [Actinomadura xylanilytica]|uniref:roadblock/LC7 domain-containing protein n=1 Tax=Actinomadura xylanilytica TaxID=887459 RepID=UPI00255B32F5|nr:roadblock/LC7 domain-containing protein [Actinomadura xylanilytica]MDL4776871.1 roadblock/LC7 domain-containing protein [Actinomadura xylanilytica]